ncbi:hypothetical protein QQ045_018886 [Rhodiola kirilowii]
MSSYTFSLDNLFDQKSNTDLCFSQFFEFSESVDVPRFDRVVEKHEDDQMQSQLSFEHLFESCEYSNESLSDVVMAASSCNSLLDCRLIEPTFEAQISNNNLRRVFSTGDLSSFVPKHALQTQRSFSERLPPRAEEIDSHKMGRYTAEQRRMSIDKYRAKRSLRNFSKTIKYECRKTLADNRPRIRGRFKRNEDSYDVQKSGEEDVIWMERFHAMSCDESVFYRGQILSDYGQTQFEYPCSFS